jgi:hypothetical protein
MFNYSHVGFQVRLYDSATYEPEVTYPKVCTTVCDTSGLVVEPG